MSHPHNEPFPAQTMTSHPTTPGKPSSGPLRWPDAVPSAGSSGRRWWIGCAVLHTCYALCVLSAGLLLALTLDGVWKHGHAATDLDVDSEGALAISLGVSLVVVTAVCVLGIIYFLTGLVLSVRRHPSGPIMLIVAAVVAVLPVRSVSIGIALWGWRDSIPTLAGLGFGVVAILVASKALGGPRRVRPGPERVASAAMPARR